MSIKDLMISTLILKNKLLCLILALAALLRFMGIYPGYHPYHSDEGMSYSSAIEMIRNLNIDPTRYDYPSLIPLINALAYIFLFIPIFILKSLLFSQEDLPTKGKNVIELWQQVVLQNQQTHVLFWGRYLTAFFGVLVVFMVYKLGAKIFNDRRVGLTAAFLTAVNFRQVLNSHLGLPDIYNAFFLLISLYFLFLLLKQPTRKNYLVAGIAIGLYFSTKFQIFMMPAFLLVHSYVVWRGSREKQPFAFLKNFVSANLLVAVFASALIVLLLNPFHWVHWEEFKAINSYNVFKYSVGVNTLHPFSFYYLYRIGIGAFATIAVLLGIFVALRKYTRNSLIILSVVLVFFYIFSYYTRGGYYTRNFVTITPLLLVFAGVFLVNAWDYLGGKMKFNKTFLNFCLVATVVFVSYATMKNSIINTYYFSKPWGFKQAHDWAKANIPEKSRVVSHPWDNYPRDKNLEIIPFEQNEIFSVAEMREDNADFGFLNMDWVTLGSYWWMGMDLEHFLQFKGRPVDILVNTFSAVSAQELASWSVAKFIKPWQAPDMNFLIVKVPEIPEIKDTEREEKVSFHFDNNDQFLSWHTISAPGGNKSINFDPQVGKDGPGSLTINAGIAKFPLVMATSPALPIEEGRMYLVEGWIKTSDDLPKKNRDGFLRVDFYLHEPSFNLGDRSLGSAVSSRVFGEPGWYKKEILVFPPKEAKFMTVSVQANNYSQFWFDDIKVYQSKEQVENPREKEPYIDYRIPDDILFPYSQGGL